MTFNLPSNLNISNITLSHNTPVYYNESLNFIGGGTDRALHRLEGTFDVFVDDTISQRALEAFLLKVRGRLNPFYLEFGTRFISETVTSNLITVTAAGTSGDTVVSTDVFAGSISAGDMFNITNDEKTYVALDDHSGAGDLSIYPPVRKDFISSINLDFLTTKIAARLTGDIQTINYGHGGLIHTSTFNWIEAIQ